MKKNIYKIGFIITVLMLLTNITPVFANNSSTPKTPASTSQPSSTTPPPASNTKANITKSSDLFAPVKSNNSSIQAVRKLIPKSKSYVTIISSIIKILLNIAGALALLGFTIGGVLMIIGTQGGQESLLKKGKDLVKATIFGLIVIAVSYALVLGVSELQFFSPGAGGTSSSTTTNAEVPSSTPKPPTK